MAKAKKTQKAAEPRIMNGHLVKEAKAPLYKVKHAKGDKPYQLSDKKIKVTLVKSTIGCLKVQQRTVEALGLKKIRSFKILNDNDAVRGMIFRVKHLVPVEELK